MAWNVVIAGGGFAGASAARELEKLLPKQSARLILVNDVNFMLYTPFLPEAAAGMLEPRHVVTPLRDMLKRTNLRLGAVSGHDPEARTVEISTHEGEDETIRYDQFLVAVGSVSRSLPVPGLDQHAIGFKSLADAIWLRNHVIETLERANASEDPERREELLTYVFVGGGYSGLEALAELQDFAADAIDRYPRARLTGMRWILVEAMDRVLPEVDQGLADYAVRELRGRGIDVRLGTRLEEAREDSCRLSTGEEIPDPDDRLDRRRRAASEPAGAQPAAHRRLEGRRRRVHARARPRGRLVDRRLRRRARPQPRRRQALPADRAARRPPGQGRRSQHRRRARRRDFAAPLRLPRQGRVREPRPLPGGRPARQEALPRLPRLVDGPDLPHEPGAGRRRGRSARSPTGPSACRSSATSPRSARSATRAR